MNEKGNTSPRRETLRFSHGSEQVTTQAKQSSKKRSEGLRSLVANAGWLVGDWMSSQAFGEPAEIPPGVRCLCYLKRSSRAIFHILWYRNSWRSEPGNAAKETIRAVLRITAQKRADEFAISERQNLVAGTKKKTDSFSI